MTALSEQTIRDEHLRYAMAVGHSAACIIVAEKFGMTPLDVHTIVLRYQFGMGA